jgi:cell shape-determining protein MreC
MLAGFIFLLAPQYITGKFQFAFARLFRWPLSIGRSFSLSAAGPRLNDTSSYRDYTNHIANLEKWLEQARRKVEELSRLRERLPLANAKLMFADAITVSDESQSGFFINRGKNHGLAKGQFVLAANSIIGTIYDVTSRSAQVKLITDPESTIAVKIGRLNVPRMMRGNGGNSARIEMVSAKHQVKTGDLVYAAPTIIFLDDLIVTGQITRCEMDDENPSLWDITVKPVCEIEQLYSVAVIIMNGQK